MVLDRDLGERLAPEAEGVHVAVGGEREETGRGVAAREQRMPQARDATAAAVLQLLGAEHEVDVERGGRECEGAVAVGVRPRSAVALGAGAEAVAAGRRL